MIITDSTQEIVSLVEPFASRRESWAQSLEHGGYIQGEEYLKRRNYDGVITHCCLGVACEVHPLGLGISHEEESGEGFEFFLEGWDTGFLSESSVEVQLTDSMMGFYGLTDSDQRILVLLNDDRVSFVTIAKIIRGLDYTIDGKVYASIIGQRSIDYGKVEVVRRLEEPDAKDPLG